MFQSIKGTLQITSYNKYKTKGAIHWIKYAVDSRYREMVNIVCDIIIKSKPKTILDIGCGDGLYDRILMQAKIKVYALDPSKQAINFCKDHGVITAMNGIIENFEFYEKYDSILLLDTLEHLKNSDQVLKKIKEWCNNLWILNPYPRAEGKSKYHVEEWTDKELILKLIKNGYKEKSIHPLPKYNKTLFCFKSS